MRKRLRLCLKKGLAEEERVFYTIRKNPDGEKVPEVKRVEAPLECQGRKRGSDELELYASI
jgi:hypothetical protein